MAKPQHTIDFLASSLDFVRGKLDDEHWLENFVRAANVDSVMCLRWGCGKPQQNTNSSFGRDAKVPVGWLNWADHILNLATPTECALLNDLAASINRPELLEARPAYNPQVLSAVIDWSPAYILMIAYRDPALGEWSDEDREHYLSVCRYARQAVLLHKELARTNNISSATADILNASPRGIIAITVDGQIQFANTLATEILGSADGINLNDGQLVLGDKAGQARLIEFIDTISILRPDQLHAGNPEAMLYANVPRPSNHTAYQIMFAGVPLTSWTIEVSPSDRMILAYIYDPHNKYLPSDQQLMDYFNLTKAQARVAVRLCANDNIVGASAELGISINTARSHLRTIYQKTGTKNQSELQSLLAGTLKSGAVRGGKPTTPQEGAPKQ